VKHKLKRLAKKGLLAVHRTGMRLGVVILPNHYYTGVPDLKVLGATREHWACRSALRGLSIDVEGQVRSLRDICLPFEPEYRGNELYRKACESDRGPGFGYLAGCGKTSFVAKFLLRTPISRSGEGSNQARKVRREVLLL
jgi:hypothetical protein